MNQTYKYFGISIISFILAIFIFKSCEKPVSKEYLHTLNVDSIVNHTRNEEREIALLNKIAKSQIDTIYKDRHHYHTIRRDSLIPCETKLILCDTIVVHDSIHDVTQDLIIAKQDSVINDWHKIHSSDSCEVVGLKKEVKRQKWQKRGIIAVWILREELGVVIK